MDPQRFIKEKDARLCQRQMTHATKNFNVVRWITPISWSWPTLTKTDFGQTKFGQTEFDLLCVMCCVLSVCVWCVLCVVVVCAVWRGHLFHGFMEWSFRCGCWFRGLVLDRPSPGPPPFPRTAQNFCSFFSLSRRKIRSFLPLWESFRGILVVFFEGRDPRMCTFGVLWLFCETPAAPKPPGRPPPFGPQPPSAPTFSGFGPPPFGPHPSGLHPLGPCFFWVWAPGLYKKTKQLKIKKNN